MKKTIEIDIPEGYEIDESKKITDQLLWSNGHCKMIPLKKSMPEKDFNWYVDKYFKTLLNGNGEISGSLMIGNTRQIINTFLKNDFNNIQFELKIGLFKFVCDDLGLKFTDAIAYEHLEFGAMINCPGKFTKLLKIIPFDLIQSLKL